ncbi:nitrite reductase (NAD(P)H) small subunit [Pseudoneobacillus sp. C159]
MNQTLTKIALMNYEMLPVNIGQLFQIGKEEVVLFRLTDGRVKAVENKSPHPKGGTLVDGLVSGKYLYCPCYDWKISLEDGKVQEPDSGEVKTYPVEIDGEMVSIIL